MEIELDYTKDVHGNAARYYEKAKEARKKREGLEKAIKETEKEIEKAKEKQESKPKMKVKREKKYYEKFHWFFTSEGKLVIGGKNAQQNDLLVSRHMEDNDLFFHADIQGGSAVVLKEGIKASKEEKLEAAQFAASFSNAWKNGNAAVDVYAVRRLQLAKHVSGGYVGAGGFAIQGEREWFKGTALGLKVGKGEEAAEILPEKSNRSLDAGIYLFPAATGKEKGSLAKSLAKRFNADVDELLQILPSGKTKTKIIS